ncbi:peptidylprolyl isomerase [Actinoplanes sp. NPDC048967]|uniref:peptidylprolyl isomerase n=1 Tax=Actinoplanes sp. NPDC048967 TaxID=3155269 RepID=UPI00340E86EE
MSSIKDRQRAAARARLEKEMAERATAARKRRQRQAIIGSALAVVVIAGAAVWIVAALGNDDDKKSTDAAAPPPGTVACSWIPEDGSTGSKVKDVGTPPSNAPNVGKSTLTMDTNLGAITASVDLSKAPCTGEAFTFLAGKKFWDNTKCHRLTTAGIKVLQCGDPTATGKGWRESDGSGGPSFRYAEENLPTNAKPAYPKGTIAMAKTSAPSSTGSQYFIVYEDTDLPPDYTVLGTITKGLDIVESVAKAGSDNANGQGDGHPKKEITIKTLTMAKG